LLSQLLPAWRARFVAALILLAFGTLAARSVWLQVVRNDFLQQKGESRYSRVIELSATRGRIADRSGDMLAVSTPVKSVWAIPEDARLTPAQARELAGLLELDVRELNRRLASEKDFVFIRRQIPPDAAEKIAALNLPGIHQQREYRRYYPAGDVTAHMLGFTGVEDRGQEGIELAFDAQLAGKPGSRRVIKDRLGRIVEDVESIKPPQDGKDLTLALDAKVQYLAFALAEHKAKAGGVVVLDVQDRRGAGAGQLPSLQPEQPRQADRRATAQPRADRHLRARLDDEALHRRAGAGEGRFTADSPIQTAPGRLSITGSTIRDAHPHGVLSVAEVIQKSSNVGTVKLAMQLKPREMWQLFSDVGFGSKPEIEFPGAVTGRLRRTRPGGRSSRRR
jgi:cell division protein FtsI (penicillin-binding protein 3)